MVPPFQVPFPIPQINYFVEPENLTSYPQLEAWFNHLILCGCGGVKDGQNWGFIVDGKVYVAIWRDTPPRPPWTRAVWDVYCISAPCGPCPSSSVSLGWFWCWNDVIKVIRSEIQRTWTPKWTGGGGQTIVIGTNVWDSSSFEKIKGPILWYENDYEISNGKIIRWIDKSGHELDSVNIEADAPSLLNASVHFDGTQWLELPLKALTEWHLFVVGKFQNSLTNDYGTVFGAMSLQPPFSGLEALISQNNNLNPEGRLGTWINPTFLFGDYTTFLDTLSIWEWVQGSSNFSSQLESRVGLNAVLQTLSTNASLSTDVWNPMLESGGFPLPIKASLGRSQRGLVLGEEFFYFEGDLKEVILYPKVLFSGQRTQVLNNLREKYSLGAPLGGSFPSFIS